MSQHQPFAALRHLGFRLFFVGNVIAMLAHNMEHVINVGMLGEVVGIRGSFAMSAACGCW
ncbi:MAG: hypothetical protein AB7F79_04345 [Steroidobacteraceae bacterium]